MRITVGATARCNSNNLMAECNWPSLTDRRLSHCLIMMYKIISGDTPHYLQDLLPNRVGDNAHYHLRNNSEIIVPFARLEIYRKSFLIAAINAWNQLDMVVRNIPTTEIFKRAVVPKKEPRKEILYYGSRWASIHHSRIRIGCSKLNHHLCNNLHVIPSPQCHCGHVCEDPQHYFFHCPLFNNMRDKMLDDIFQITNSPATLEILLHGDSLLDLHTNKRIFNAVHVFLKETKRFA